MADMTPIGPYDRTDPNFKAQLDDIFGVQLPRFVTEANAKAAQMTSAATGGGFTIGYVFSTTTTDSDPGAGLLRLDNATQNLATTIRADVQDLGGTDWSPVLATFTASSSVVKGQIRLSKMSDGTKWLTFNLTAIATPTGYRNITVTCVGSSAASPFSNGDIVMMSFSRTGDKGDQGVPGMDSATAIQYAFDTTTTDADPGAGKLRLSSATQNASTVIRADLADINAADMTTLLDTFDDSTNTIKGQIRLSKLGDATKFIVFALTSMASPAGYRNISGTVVASSASNPFANADTLVLSFVRAGDAGVSGNIIEIGSVIPMSQTANLVTLNGSDYLKTGVLAASGSYTSAPLQNVFSDTTKSITSGNWAAVASGGGITVAISNTSATSQISYDNGYTWSPITVPNAGYNAICYGNGQFVAVGNSVCATSTDGVNWTAQTIAALDWRAIIYDGTNYVAIANSTTVGTYSANGTSWSASALPSSLSWASLCFGNGLILATHSGTVSSACASSADHGVTWSSRTLSIAYNNYVGNCAFGNGVFVVNQRDNGGGSTSNISTSADCVTWATKNLGVTFSETKTLTFAGGLFMLTKATTKTCYTSPDGITWTTRTGVATHAATAVCVANGGRVIGVQGGSTTGIDIFNVAYGRGYHIALFADQQNQGLPFYMRMN